MLAKSLYYRQFTSDVCLASSVCIFCVPTPSLHRSHISILGGTHLKTCPVRQTSLCLLLLFTHSTKQVCHPSTQSCTQGRHLYMHAQRGTCQEQCKRYKAFLSFLFGTAVVKSRRFQVLAKEKGYRKKIHKGSLIV